VPPSRVPRSWGPGIAKHSISNTAVNPQSAAQSHLLRTLSSRAKRRIRSCCCSCSSPTPPQHKSQTHPKPTAVGEPGKQSTQRAISRTILTQSSVTQNRAAPSPSHSGVILNVAAWGPANASSWGKRSEGSAFAVWKSQCRSLIKGKGHGSQITIHLLSEQISPDEWLGLLPPNEKLQHSDL
jgi:hypothetical protein